MILDNWIILTLLSAILFALKDIMAKKFFNKNVTPTQLVFEEYLIFFLVIIILFPYKVDFLSFISYWHLYLLKAISVGTSTILYFYLLKKYDISLVSPILNLSPLILVFLSPIFLSESITKMQLLGIVIIIFFTYYLEITINHHHTKNPHKHHFQNLKEILQDKLFGFSIISLIIVTLLSFAAISDRLILREVNEFTNIYFTSIIILTILFIYYIKENHLLKTFKNLVKEPETFPIAIFTITSNFLILKAIAIPTAMVSLIIPLRRTSTLFGTIIGGVMFHEKHLGKKIFAGSGMFLGVLIIVL